MMRRLQTSSVIFQKNNRTVTLTPQDFLTNRGYRAGFDVFIKYCSDILLVSRLERLNENAVSRRHGSSWRGKGNILYWLYFKIFSFHWFFMSGRLQEELSCRCKSTCSTKSGRIRVGCPCKTANKKCTSQCSCGTRQKPCKNKVTVSQLFIICHNKHSQYSCSVYK